MKDDKVKIGLACICFTKSFWGYKESQYKNRINQLRILGKKLDFELVATPTSFQRAREAIITAHILNDHADIAILDIATFPEGKAAKAFYETLEIPLILWSRPEQIHNTNITHNSFCGANFLASCLSLQGRRFRKVFGDVDSEDFQSRLLTAIRLIESAKKVRGAHIGLFGNGIVPKFVDIDVIPEDRQVLEKRWGFKYIKIPIKDLIDQATLFSSIQLEKEIRKFIKHFNTIEVSQEAIKKQVAFFMAIREIVKKENLASIAIRCWPELQNLYGMWPCPAMSILNELKIPAACEGDPGGALDMLLASQLSDIPSTLVDIIDWSDEKNVFSIWHCGPTAPSWAEENKTRLIPHNVDGSTESGKPAFGLPGVVDMVFSPGPVTVFRTLGALDDEFVMQGDLVDAPQKVVSGSFGAVMNPTVYLNKIDTRYLRQQILDRGIPHHYTAVRGYILK